MTCIGIYLINKVEKRINGIILCIKCILIVLIIYIISSSNILFNKNKFEKGNNSFEAKYNTEFVRSINHTKNKTSKSYSPDVYYIVADSYTSSESLKKYWGYDNSPFENELERNGFIIAKKSKSFYPVTQISMDSTLNMSNEESIKKRKNFESFESIKSNETISMFKKLGYSIINYSLFDLGDKEKYYNYLDDEYIGHPEEYLNCNNIWRYGKIWPGEVQGICQKVLKTLDMNNSGVH